MERIIHNKYGLVKDEGIAYEMADIEHQVKKDPNATSEKKKEVERAAIIRGAELAEEVDNSKTELEGYLYANEEVVVDHDFLKELVGKDEGIVKSYYTISFFDIKEYMESLSLVFRGRGRQSCLRERQMSGLYDLIFINKKNGLSKVFIDCNEVPEISRYRDDLKGLERHLQRRLGFDFENHKQVGDVLDFIEKVKEAKESQERGKKFDI